MKKNAWRIIYGISLFAAGTCAVILAADSLAAQNGGVFLPDILIKVFGIVDAACLFLFVLSRIKGRN